MKKLLLFATVYLLSVSGASAQTPFSDVGVRYDGLEDTFFPNLKGTFGKRVADTTDQESLGYDRRAAAAFVANLNRILSIFESCALLNPPRGLQIEGAAFSSVRKVFAEKGPRLEAIIEISAFAYAADEKGSPGKFAESGDSLTLHINNPTVLVGAPVLEDIYVQPARTADFHGHPVNETGRGEVAVLTAITRPLYVPVSREDFIKASIRYWQQKLKESASEGAEAVADRSSRQEFELGRGQRRKDFEDAYAVLKKADRAAAEEFRKTFEETERELEREMAGNKDYSVSKKEVLAEADALHSRKIRELREELAALSSKEKSAQAYYSSGQREVNASGLVPSDHPGAEALIRINRELFDASRPQSDVQLVILDWHDLKPMAYAGDKKGFDLQKWLLAELCKRDDVWRPIINMLSD